MKIALGVTGGVAAYKAAELVRRLQQENLDVQVVMTRAAQEFITPLTFAALTGKKVITEMFGADGSPRPPTSKAPSSTSPSRSASIFCSSRRPPPTSSRNSRTASPTIFFPLSISPRKRPSSSLRR